MIFLPGHLQFSCSCQFFCGIQIDRHNMTAFLLACSNLYIIIPSLRKEALLCRGQASSVSLMLWHIDTGSVFKTTLLSFSSIILNLTRPGFTFEIPQPFNTTVIQSSIVNKILSMDIGMTMMLTKFGRSGTIHTSRLSFLKKFIVCIFVASYISYKDLQ